MSSVMNMDAAPGTAFDDGVYNTSARSKPFDTDQAYPLQPGNSYDLTGWQSWNQYLNSIPVDETIGYVFDPSYSLSASADSTDAVDILDGVSGPSSWSLGQGDTYRRADQVPLPPAKHIALDARSGYLTQQPDRHHRLDAYGNQQLLHGQQQHHQDVVSTTVSPGALSKDPAQHPGIAADQSEQQGTFSEQQTSANLPQAKKPRSKSTAGTKRRNTVDNGDAQRPAAAATKRRKQPSKRPVLAPVDTWTPQTPHTLHASNSYSSLAGSGTSAASGFSPVMYERPSVASLADDLDASSARRDSPACHGLPSPLDAENVGGHIDPLDNLVPPAQRVAGWTDLSQFPATAESLIPTPTSATYLRAGSASFSFPSASTAASASAGAGERAPASHPNTRSFSHAKTPSSSSSSSSITTRTTITASSSNPRSTTAPDRRRTKTRPLPDPAPASPDDRTRSTSSSRRRGSGRRLSMPEYKARNRVAATKCRLKTKATVERLETLEAAGAERNRALAAAAAGLRREVYELHNMLLLHVDCGCEMIQAYLVKRARALAEGAAADGGGSLVGKEGGQGKKEERRPEEKGGGAVEEGDGVGSPGGAEQPYQHLVMRSRE